MDNKWVKGLLRPCLRLLDTPQPLFHHYISMMFSPDSLFSLSSDQIVEAVLAMKGQTDGVQALEHLEKPLEILVGHVRWHYPKVVCRLVYIRVC